VLQNALQSSDADQKKVQKVLQSRFADSAPKCSMERRSRPKKVLLRSAPGPWVGLRSASQGCKISWRTRTMDLMVTPSARPMNPGKSTPTNNFQTYAEVITCNNHIATDMIKPYRIPRIWTTYLKMPTSRSFSSRCLWNFLQWWATGVPILIKWKSLHGIQRIIVVQKRALVFSNNRGYSYSYNTNIQNTSHTLPDSYVILKIADL